MSKLPTVRNKELASRKEKAVARRDAFAKKAAALRKATGKKLTRTLSCACAETGQRFDVIFERVSNTHRFHIARIEKGKRIPRGGLNSLGNLFGTGVGSIKGFSVDEFDMSGWVCPWCGEDEERIICTSCGYIVCGARMRTLANGKKHYSCHDACGASGMLEPTKSVPGSSGSPGSPASKSLPKLPRAARNTLHLEFRSKP